MICANCKSEITDTSKFCKKCGASVVAAPVATSETKTCPSCGTVNAANAKFCKKDGYNFGTPASMIATVLEADTPAPQPAAIPPAVKPVNEPKTQEATSKPTISVEDVLICPKCGTPNLPGAKFCKKDGYALQAGVATPQAIPVPKPAPIKQPAPAQSAVIGGAATENNSRKGLVIGALVGVVLLASAGGGYAYWAGYFGDRQGAVQASINAELGSRGLSTVKVTIDREWNASLSGTVLNQADKDQALALIQGHKELKKIASETIQILPGTADLEKTLNKALADAGLGAVSAQVDQELVALLKGVVDSTDQKAHALKVANGVTGLKNVIDDIQVATIEIAPQAIPAEIAPPTPQPLPPQPTASAPRVVKMGPPQAPTSRPQATAIDPAKLEGDINRALRSQNVSGVTAQVGDDLSVTLKGSGSASEKGRALQVVRQFSGVRAVKDKIFVIE